MKKKVGTLLAVTLVAAAPAAAGPMHAHGKAGASEGSKGDTRAARAKVDGARDVDGHGARDAREIDGRNASARTNKPDPWAGRTDGATFPSNMPDSFRRIQGQMLIDGVFAMFGVTTPRVLRSGSPACGNVQSKGPRDPQCEDE